MFSAKPQDIVNNNNSNSNLIGNNLNAITAAITTTINSCSTTAHQQAQALSTNMISTAPPSIADVDQNGNQRDRTHLTLDFKDLKPREQSNSGLSPILPLSLLDSSLLMSPEKILLAAHQNQQQLQQHQQQQKLETPTPSNFIFPKHVTTAQETFAEGFQKALQKLQGDTSLPTFQNNSPSTVKFLLSLAALTPTLSPSAPNKSLLSQLQQHQQQSHQNPAAPDLNLAGKLAAELPKIVVNNPAVVSALTAATSTGTNPSEAVLNTTNVSAASSTSTANDLAKRYMEYFQLGQSASSASNSSSSSNDFIQQVPQFHPPPPAPPAMGMGQSQPKQLQQPNFIKKEPTCFGDHHMAGESSVAMMQQIAPQLLNGGGGVTIGQPAVQPALSSATGRRKDSMSESDGKSEQDIRKLERKRARNRLAASKCRQRKLQRISDLELQVAEEQQRGCELQEEIVRLQNMVKQLQDKLNNSGAGNGPLNGHMHAEPLNRQNY